MHLLLLHLFLVAMSVSPWFCHVVILLRSTAFFLLSSADGQFCVLLSTPQLSYHYTLDALRLSYKSFLFSSFQPLVDGVIFLDVCVPLPARASPTLSILMLSIGHLSSNVIVLSSLAELQPYFIAACAFTSVLSSPLFLSSSLVVLATLVALLNFAPPFEFFVHCWKWPPGFQVNLDDLYQGETTSDMAQIFDLVVHRECGISHGLVLFIDLNVNGNVLLLSSVFQYVFTFLELLDTQRFVSSMRIGGYNLYKTSQRHSLLTATDAWLQR